MFERVLNTPLLATYLSSISVLHEHKLSLRLFELWLKKESEIITEWVLQSVIYITANCRVEVNNNMLLWLQNFFALAEAIL